MFFGRTVHATFEVHNFWRHCRALHFSVSLQGNVKILWIIAVHMAHIGILAYWPMDALEGTIVNFTRQRESIQGFCLCFKIQSTSTYK